MAIVAIFSQYYPQKDRGRPVSLGFIYVGNPDTDPKIEANRKVVTLRLEDGSSVEIQPADQPLTTGGGGVVVYNDMVARPLTDGDFSILVEDRGGDLEYYFPNNEGLIDLSMVTGSQNGNTKSNMNAWLDAQWQISQATARAIPVNAEISAGDQIHIAPFGTNWIVETGVAPDDLGYYLALANYPSLHLRYTGDYVTPEIFGAAGDDSTDDSAAIEAAIKSGIKNILLDNPYYCGVRKAFSAITDLNIYGSGTVRTDVMEGIWQFNNCDNIKISNIMLQGGETRAVWEAYTPAERQQLISLVEMGTCPNLVIENVRSTQHRSAFKLEVCNRTKIDKCQHVGCYGEISLGVVTDPNFGYAYYIRGGRDHTLIEPMSDESSGTVLVQLTAPNVNSFGGYARNCHDNGWYGSSCRDTKVIAFHIQEGLQTGVKTRGYNNIIQACTAIGLSTSYGFDMTGIPLNSEIDSQGAVGQGGGIFNCTADNCDSLASIRFTSETGPLLYLRDTKCIGNTGTNLTGVANHPIEIYGVVNIEAKDNTINTFAAPFAILAQGPSTGSKGESYDITGNNASNGAALIRTSVLKNSRVDNNGYTNMSGTQVIDTVDCENMTFTNNKGDDVTSRIDCRSSTNMKAFRNDMFIQSDAGQIDAQDNMTQPTVDVLTVIPNRIGRIVQDIIPPSGTGNMYISKGTAAVGDWVAM